MADFSKEG
jgi:hypothetical protein